MIRRLVWILGHAPAADSVDREGVFLLGEGGRDAGVAGDGDRLRVVSAGEIAAPTAEGPAWIPGGGKRHYITVVIGRLVRILGHAPVADDVDRQRVLFWGEGSRDDPAPVHRRGCWVIGAGEIAAPAGEGPARVGRGGQRDHLTTAVIGFGRIGDHRATADDIDGQRVPGLVLRYNRRRGVEEVVDVAGVRWRIAAGVGCIRAHRRDRQGVSERDGGRVDRPIIGVRLGPFVPLPSHAHIERGNIYIGDDTVDLDSRLQWTRGTWLKNCCENPRVHTVTVELKAQEIVAVLFDEHSLHLILPAHPRLELDLDLKVSIVSRLHNPGREVAGGPYVVARVSRDRDRQPGIFSVGPRHGLRGIGQRVDKRPQTRIQAARVEVVGHDRCCRRRSPGGRGRDNRIVHQSIHQRGEAVRVKTIAGDTGPPIWIAGPSREPIRTVPAVRHRSQ